MEINNQDNEYVCRTCVLNLDLTKIIEYEQTHTDQFIPYKLRKTVKVGLVFTKGSYMFAYHILHGLKHDWRKYV